MLIVLNEKNASWLRVGLTMRGAGAILIQNVFEAFLRSAVSTESTAISISVKHQNTKVHLC